jgi:hypothetical protein
MQKGLFQNREDMVEPLLILTSPLNLLHGFHQSLNIEFTNTMNNVGYCVAGSFLYLHIFLTYEN